MFKFVIFNWLLGCYSSYFRKSKLIITCLRNRSAILILLFFLYCFGVKSQCAVTLASVAPTCSTPGGYILTIPNNTNCTGSPPYPTPYQLLWFNSGTCPNPTLTSVPGPGSYTITFAAAQTCSYNVVVFDNLGNTIIGQDQNKTPPGASSSAFFTVFGQNQPSCFGNCNGTSTLLWTIFAPPLQATLTSPTSLGNTTKNFTISSSSIQTYTGLCAGTHTFNTLDANGCAFNNLTFTITQPTSLTATSATAQPSCNGGNNGSFSVMPAGGTATYAVVFSNSSSVTVGSGGVATATGFPAGVVSATVTDSKGCSLTVTNTIGQPSSMTITSTQTNVTCGGSCTGAASVTVLGGGGSYTYTWSPGPGNSPFISSLCGGMVHTLTIKDANNCVRTQTVNITQPTSITITPTITNVTCNGGCNGSVSVTATGPAGTINFTWTTSSGSIITTGSVISGRCPDNYILLASVSPTCVSSFTIPVTQPPAITLTPVTQSITCRGLCTGAATITPTGGNGAPFTYTWSPAGTSGASNNSLCAGPHTVSVRDASNCAATTSFTILQPAAFAFGITTSSITCNGLCNGVINASPSGGTAPYTYTLASSVSTVASGSPIFNGLCAGTYTLFVRDNLSTCAQQTTLALIQPNVLAGAIASTTITCFGSCNGALAGSASGGTPPYTFFWSTSGGTVSGGALSSLCAGNYTFHVSDGNGCVAPTVTTSLVAPPDITVTIAATSPSCAGSCNGILSATVLPAATYTLNWVNNGFSGNPNTGLCAGVYTLNVNNSNGCIKTRTVNLVAPPAIVLTQTVSATRCAGSCDGSATVAATGGTGSYTFQFNSSPVQTNTTGIAGSLCAGGYIANATDANGCTQAANINIGSPVALSAALTGTRNSCTSCTGGATVTASNGTAPFTYAWTNTLNASAGTGSAISNFCPGNYTVLVTDSRSCTATTSVSIGQIVIAAAVSGGSGIQCFGACTASAVAVVSGGQSPYSFTWSPGGQTTGTAVSLCAGNYTVNISDSGSPACSSTAAITITQPADLVVTTSQTNITCFNSCNGAIGATVSGGTGPITYSWSPGGQTTPTISSLCAGGYTLKITDGNGCTKPPVTFSLSAPLPPITATLNAFNPTQCIAPNDGSICVTAAGGTGAYNYTWSPAVAGNTNCAKALVAGTYSVIVSSGVCSNTFFTVLSNPNGPTLTQLSLQPVSCFNGTNGAISYSVSGTGPFTFSWTPAVSFTNSANSSSVSGLSSGTYVIASADVNQCITTRTIFVSQNSSVTINGTVNNILCNGATCNGSINVTPSGGISPYTYTWSTGSNNSSVTSLCAGTYTVNLRDNNLCSYSRTFAVNMPAALSVSASVTNVKCNSMCNGSITANTSGGTGIITYSWLPAGPFSGSTTATILNLCANLYTLNVRDVNGCTATTVIPLTEPPVLTSSLVFSNATCFNLCNGSATLTGAGGVPGYTFSWSNGGAAGATLSSVCAGNYTGTVKDANGCSSAQGFTVTSPPPFTATLSATHPLCNSVCNGSITTLISGAQGPVTFSWSPAGTGQNPVNLCPSTYTVLATDASSCVVQSVITLTNPPALLANVNFTNPTCNGNCNGIAVSVPINANPPLTYTWLPAGPNSATNTALCAGVYTISIADKNACSVSQTFALTEPAALNINASIGPATCGSSDGSITAVPVGGTPSYTYVWSSPFPPPIATTGSVVTNLPAGIYTVQITDANNCSNTVTIPLSNSNGPTAPLTSTNVLCNGACTGAASVGLITSGTAPYATPLWVIPVPTVQSSFISNLCAGNYSVELRDNLNCITFTGTTITQPPAISILPVMSLPLCSGVCNGSVTINTSGGVSPYTYTWTPGAASGSVVNNLCAGTYSILVGYNGGACVSPPIVLTVPAASSITIAPPAVTPNKCFADCLGSATVNVIPGGGLPFGAVTYNWSNGQNGNSANNLCTGTYSLLITDSQGCNNTFSVGISSPLQIKVNASVNQPLCGRCDGAATVTASGGTGSAYSYNWTNGNTGNIADGLCAGVYQVLVVDSLNCRNTENVVVNNSNGITGESISKQDETCGGLCNGAATITPVGGSGPVQFNWLGSTPSNSNNTAAGLCAGNYFIQMTDAAGCIRTSSLQINSSVTITLATFVNNSSCSPTNNGTIVVVPSGGTPAYSYSWTPSISANSVIANIGAGSYTVTVSDKNGTGCSVTRIIPVSNNTGPQFSAVQQDNNCAQQCTGSVSLTATSTVVPSYIWSNGSTGASVTNLCSGVITVTGSAGGCSTVRTFTIRDNAKLQLETFSGQVLCSNECLGSVHLQATGGTLPYTFSWTPATSSLSAIDSLCAGRYNYTVTDFYGCVVSGSDSIIKRPPIVVTPTITNSSCSSVADGALGISVTGGTPAYSFTWTGPAPFTSTSQNISQIYSGTYSLNLRDSLNCTADTILSVAATISVTANAGNDLDLCPGSSTILNAVNSQSASTFAWYEVPPAKAISNNATLPVTNAVQSQTYILVAYGSNTLCSDTDKIVLNVFTEPLLDAGPTFTIPVFSTVIIGGNPTSLGIESLTWSPAFTLNDANAQNPVASNTTDVTYTVSIIYGTGCMVSDTMRVILYPEIKITSGFTPNDDGKNDKWVIDHIDQFPDNTVEIFNRWGESLFYSKGYANPFDGMYNGKDLPVGTYYYVIHLNHPSYPKPYVGPLTIFR